jgi:alpha-ketoglutarate-dependent taurine dioxygenase
MRVSALLSPANRASLTKTGRCELRLRSRADLVQLAESLGTPVPMRPHGPTIEILTPTPSSMAPPASLSSLHGVGAFPLHTDGAHHRRPPRWVLLRCVEPGASQRPTYIADVRSLELDQEQVVELKRAVWRIRNGFRSFLASVILPAKLPSRNRETGKLFLRYDPGCMTPADVAFMDTAAMLCDHIGKVPPDLVDWDRDLAIVIDNWRVLHGRAPSPTTDTGVRRLERIAVAGECG